jgi:hypothetical protein
VIEGSDLTVLGAVQEVKANAASLDLTWALQPATVIAYDATMGVAKIILDGDVTVTPAISLISTLLVNERVMTVHIPPSGVYVIAQIGANASGPPYQSRQILSAAASSVTFSGIPTTLRRLECHFSARGTSAFDVNQVFFRINNDSSGVYYAERLAGNNATASAGPENAVTQGPIGLLTGTLAPANVYGSGAAVFVSWDSPNAGSLGYTFTSQALGTGVGNFFTFVGGGIYRADGPYTSLILLPQTGSFESGSDFQITGWRA